MEEKDNSKVIDITKRIRSREISGKAESSRLETVKKAVFCFLCQFRCSMCGIQISEGVGMSVNLCKDCAMEYRDYLDLKEGKEVDLRPYQDDRWAKVWEKWEELRKAMLEYKNNFLGLEG